MISEWVNQMNCNGVFEPWAVTVYGDGGGRFPKIQSVLTLSLSNSPGGSSLQKHIFPFFHLWNFSCTFSLLFIISGSEDLIIHFVNTATCQARGQRWRPVFTHTVLTYKCCQGRLMFEVFLTLGELYLLLFSTSKVLCSWLSVCMCVCVCVRGFCTVERDVSSYSISDFCFCEYVCVCACVCLPKWKLTGRAQLPTGDEGRNKT